MRVARIGIALVLVVLPWGCSSDGGDGDNQCTKGQQVSCDCAGGLKGTQVCGADGSFGMCSCGGGTAGSSNGGSAGTSNGGSSGSSNGGSAGAGGKGSAGTTSAAGSSQTGGMTNGGASGAGAMGGSSSGGTAGGTAGGSAGTGGSSNDNDCHLGEDCQGPTDCCTELDVECKNQTCCRGARGTCSQSGDCCGGLPCTNQVCCRPLGEPCKTSMDCCSSSAQGHPMSCGFHGALAGAFCGHSMSGAPCSSEKDCANNVCGPDGKCM